MTSCKHDWEPLGKGWRCKKCGWLAVVKPEEKKPAAKRTKKVSTAPKKAE